MPGATISETITVFVVVKHHLLCWREIINPPAVSSLNADCFTLASACYIPKSRPSYNEFLPVGAARRRRLPKRICYCTCYNPRTTFHAKYPTLAKTHTYLIMLRSVRNKKKETKFLSYSDCCYCCIVQIVQNSARSSNTTAVPAARHRSRDIIVITQQLCS